MFSLPPSPIPKVLGQKGRTRVDQNRPSRGRFQPALIQSFKKLHGGQPAFPQVFGALVGSFALQRARKGIAACTKKSCQLVPPESLAACHPLHGTAFFYTAFCKAGLLKVHPYFSCKRFSIVVVVFPYGILGLGFGIFPSKSAQRRIVAYGQSVGRPAGAFHARACLLCCL